MSSPVAYHPLPLCLIYMSSPVACHPLPLCLIYMTSPVAYRPLPLSLTYMTRRTAYQPPDSPWIRTLIADLPIRHYTYHTASPTTSRPTQNLAFCLWMGPGYTKYNGRSLGGT